MFLNKILNDGYYKSVTNTSINTKSLCIICSRPNISIFVPISFVTGGHMLIDSIIMCLIWIYMWQLLEP